MTPLQAVIVGFVFVSFLQDSFEADFTSVPDLKAASDIKVFLKRRAICKSLCRSKSQDITHFEKVRKDVKIWVCVFSMCIWRLVYSIIIFSFDKLSLCIEHTRLLRSQAGNEIFLYSEHFQFISYVYFGSSVRWYWFYVLSHFDARVFDCSSNYDRKCFSNTFINSIPSVRFLRMSTYFCLYTYTRFQRSIRSSKRRICER